MKYSFVITFILCVTLAGCVTSPIVQPAATPIALTATATQPPDLPTPTQPALQTPSLATPVADSPAAGICDFYPGDLVVFEIYPDIPNPRCARATLEQRLKVINRTEQELRIRIAGYDFTLQPDQEQEIDAELGSYLAPGVHQVSTTAYSGGGGPELWLTTDP
jgi:glucose/arabinose dehydrogenase